VYREENGCVPVRGVSLQIGRGSDRAWGANGCRSGRGVSNLSERGFVGGREGDGMFVRQGPFSLY